VWDPQLRARINWQTFIDTSSTIGFAGAVRLEDAGDRKRKSSTTELPFFERYDFPVN
jgi:hypothetical protein